MENIKHKSEDVAKKEFTPKETACSSGSKEYNTFISIQHIIPLLKNKYNISITFPADEKSHCMIGE